MYGLDLLQLPTSNGTDIQAIADPDVRVNAKYNDSSLYDAAKSVGFLSALFIADSTKFMKTGRTSLTHRVVQTRDWFCPWASKLWPETLGLSFPAPALNNAQVPIK